MRYSKTNARKTIYKGLTYDSKLEAAYAKFLDDLKSRGKIKDWVRQISFKLPNLKGKMCLRYDADMVVIDNRGWYYIMEVKGRLLPENVVKYSYFQYYYGLKINLVFTEYDRSKKLYKFDEKSSLHCPWLSDDFRFFGFREIPDNVSELLKPKTSR